VAVQDLLAVGTGCGHGAVGVQGDAPRPAMHGDQMMERTEQDHVGQAGRATLGTRNNVVRLTGHRRLVAAGESAAAIAHGHRAAQMHRDGLGQCADVQRQAYRRDRPRSQPGPQVRRQAARARQQVGRGLDDHLSHGPLGPPVPGRSGVRRLVWRGGLRAVAGAAKGCEAESGGPVRARSDGADLTWPRWGAVQQRSGEAVQHAGVDAAGHHRDDLRVAVITRAGGRLARPGGFGFGGAGQAAQPVQVHMQHDLRRLPRPLGQTSGPGKPPAGLTRNLHRDLRHTRALADPAGSTDALTRSPRPRQPIKMYYLRLQSLGGSVSSTSDLLASAPFVIAAAAAAIGSSTIRSLISAIFERPKQHTIIVRHADREIKLEAASNANIEQVMEALLMTMKGERETAASAKPERSSDNEGEGLNASGPQAGRQDS
jgi:hypothetical protein